MSDIRTIAKKKGLDFDTPDCLKENDYETLMGITEENFERVLSLVKPLMQSSKIRSAKTCLGILLVKLRTGLSHNVLSTLFNIKKSLISSAVKTARKALLKSFVPVHLGIQHISRENLIKDHTRSLAQKLFNAEADSVILVADGTYIYIQKSHNYSSQRRCFSMHKDRSLIKPMMLVATTGYMLDVFSPYFADTQNNDANILTHLIKSDAHSIRD